MSTTAQIMKSIVYYPHLRKTCGSVTSALFFSMLMDRGAYGQMVYLPSDEIESLTGLTYLEQSTARRNLRKNGLIKEHYDRLNHKLMFSIVVEDGK